MSKWLIVVLSAALALSGLVAQADGERPLSSAEKPSPQLDAQGAPEKWWLQQHIEYTARARQGNIDLYFIGDSITYGWIPWGHEAWDKEFSGYKAANFGISGDSTQNVLYRVQNGELDGVKPKVVVLMIGTNNLANSAEEVVAGTTAIVQQIRQRQPQAHIILMGLLPREDADPALPLRTKYQTVNALLARLDDGQHIYFLNIWDRFLTPDLKNPKAIPKELMSDGIHPTPRGYELWANALRPILRAWLGEPVNRAPAPQK